MTRLTEIYETLRDAGLCESQREFSRDFLAKSGGYYAQITATNARPTLSAIGALVGALHALVTDDTRRPADYVDRRRLRSAWIAAAVMLDDERQRRDYPARRFTHPFESAIEDNQ